MNFENEICINCNANNSLIIDNESEELVCSNCGLVYEENEEDINGNECRADLIIEKLLSSADVEKKLIEETKELYNKFAKIKNMQGKNIKNIILGIFYYVCNKEKCTKTIKDIALMFNVPETVIKKAFFIIKHYIIV